MLKARGQLGHRYGIYNRKDLSVLNLLSIVIADPKVDI